jgi:hypothetical protein
MMEQHPVERRLIRMSRAIDSRHGGREASGIGPTSSKGSRLPEKTDLDPPPARSLFLKTSTIVHAQRRKWETHERLENPEI